MAEDKNLEVYHDSSSIRIIDMIDFSQLESIMAKIAQFQTLVKNTFQPHLDFGIIPGTNKPTLLKPGAEKICMLMGLRSEFGIESVKDYEKGFFQYQIKCKLYRGEILITEGIGSCNSREKKYSYKDGFDVDNTILKMAKKRALVDAALMVGSLSDCFTQDLEDMDISGGDAKADKVYTDNDGCISTGQQRRAFAISKGNADLVKQVMKNHGYTGTSAEIKKIDYEKICKDIEASVQPE